MLIAGIGRNRIDFYVQLYSIPCLIALLLIFVSFAKKGINYQDTRVLRFYQKYCDVNGELKDKYLAMIYRDDDKIEEELNMNASNHSGSVDSPIRSV